MQFAVVDIETTGGYAAANGITEISVFITDGVKVVDSYYCLLNPEVPIPPFIESLTGITNERVAEQPTFRSIAPELHSILSGKVFVAHNVNFDYSFVNFHLQRCGFQLDSRKLCTIRLSRKVVPGLKGYGLDRICNHFKIDIIQRHSATGDAKATTELLHLLIQRGGTQHIDQMLTGRVVEGSLPPNVSVDNIEKLPQRPGIYFFHQKGGKVIYVGKAANIRKRVKSHFANNRPGRQKQDFLRSIYRVTYEETATELMAMIREGIEIKRLWPAQNRSQKRFEQIYGLYTYTDSQGFRRIFIERKLRHQQPIHSFNHLTEGYGILRTMVQRYKLCPYLCFLIPKREACSESDYTCSGACRNMDSVAGYNARVEQAIDEIFAHLPSFAIIDRGLTTREKSCVLIENGRLTGIGYIPADSVNELDQLKRALTPCPDNAYLRGLAFRHAERHPYQLLRFPEGVAQDTIVPRIRSSS